MAESLVRTLAEADLARLGFRQDDASDFAEVVKGLLAAPDRLRRVEELSEQLRRQIGHYFLEDPGVSDLNGLNTFDDGLVTLLALVSISGDVHADYVRRGVPSDVAWASLADLGQQVHIFRTIFGFLGLVAQTWCAENYTGRHLWLGRLQFTVERDDEGHFLGVHIPETGPLTAQSVDESLALATTISQVAFAHCRPTRFVLHSWLLDPGVVEQLDPDSNFVRFARRFELTGDSYPGWRDGLFFGFHVEPGLQPVDLSALPRDTSLRRAILRQIDGPGVRAYVGELKGPPLFEGARARMPAPPA